MATMDPDRLIRAGDLVGNAEIARRLGVADRTVLAWRLRHADTWPDELTIPGIDRVPAYSWPDVEAWHEAHTHLLGRGRRTDLA